MEKTIKLLACTKNEKLYKTTTGKIYSRHKLISLIKNNKAIVKTSSGAEVSIFSFEGKEFLRSNHNNKESDNLSETLLPFSILKQHFWWLAGLLCLGIIASNIAYPLIILDHHKTDLSSFITENDLGEIESETGPAIQSRVVELNSKASDLDWSQLTFTQITPTSAHIDAKNNSKLYSGHVNVVFSIPPIQYNDEGTNWPGYISGSLTCANFDTTSYTCSISASSNYEANDLTIPSTIVHNGVSYDLITIGDGAFQADQLLTGNLTFSNNLTTLKAAFAGCHNLKGQINFTNTITSIDEFAFSSTPFTGSLILPENPSLTFLGWGTFAYCAFTSLVIPKNITMVDWSFSNVRTCVAISCNYDTLPEFTYDEWQNTFSNWSSNGTVSNIGSLSSTDVCNYLISKGLPAGWTPA